ncbi:MAG TPA: hypothetical protein VIF57_21305 [Polyangia bacterium]|jgi:hypothetical protein
MACLAPCPACQRHIASSETTCPFCAAALPESFRCQPARALPPGRLSRAAMVAAGAALVSVSCGATAVEYGVGVISDAGATSAVDGSDDGDAAAQLEQTPARNDNSTPPVKPERN